MPSDAQGIPLAVAVSGANMHDSLALKPLIRGIPAVRSRRGPRRRRPVKLRADKAYFSAEHLAWLSAGSSRASRGPASSPANASHQLSQGCLQCDASDLLPICQVSGNRVDGLAGSRPCFWPRPPPRQGAVRVHHLPRLPSAGDPHTVESGARASGGRPDPRPTSGAYRHTAHVGFGKGNAGCFGGDVARITGHARPGWPRPGDNPPPNSGGGGRLGLLALQAGMRGARYGMRICVRAVA